LSVYFLVEIGIKSTLGLYPKNVIMTYLKGKRC